MGAHEAYTPDEARESRAQGRCGDRGCRPSAGGGDRRRPHRRREAGPSCVGLPRPDARINLSPLGFVAEGRSLIGSYLGSAVPSREIPHFVGLWRAGRLPVESLVSSRITLDDINSGMDQLADGNAVRQIISFD